MRLGGLLDGGPFLCGGRVEDVQTGDVAACFEDGGGEGYAQAAAAACDDDGLFAQGEEGCVGGVVGGCQVGFGDFAGQGEVGYDAGVACGMGDHCDDDVDGGGGGGKRRGVD